jgi:hypothetical protein
VTRLYLPATLTDLAALAGDRRLVVPDDVVVAADDTEDKEYAALVTAAEASADHVAGLGDGLRRRLVVVVEVEGTPSSVALADVVAVHVDPVDDAHPDDDLGWYATQEIPHLLG